MAKKKASTKPCTCAEQVDKKLAESGVELDNAFSCDFSTGQMASEYPLVAVRWKDKPKRGKSLPTLTCAYCPFCGKKK